MIEGHGFGITTLLLIPNDGTRLDFTAFMITNNNFPLVINGKLGKIYGQHRDKWSGFPKYINTDSKCRKF